MRRFRMALSAEAFPAGAVLRLAELRRSPSRAARFKRDHEALGYEMPSSLAAT